MHLTYEEKWCKEFHARKMAKEKIEINYTLMNELWVNLHATIWKMALVLS